MELLWVVCVLCVGIGFAGAVLPAIPGPPLVFAGLVAGAAADDFERVGWGALAVLFLLTCLTFGIDFAATALGAQRAGASKLAIVGALAGSLVGLAFGLPGLLLGPFVGAIAGEWTARRDLLQAGKVAFATWLGMLFAALAKLTILLAMVALFALAWWL